ncbi:hypothetical protein, partial [Escherichia coli]|uniref:hypothetical protein n=1 Tax=Escherichia coli TaxID=562 RepID=UPI0015FFEE54
VQAQAPVASSVQRIEPAMLAGPTAKELEHISDVPAIVRLKKVNLNDWYLANSSRKTMKSKRAAFADDLRKIGTTAVAASLVGIFLSEHRLLTAYAFVMGMV